MNQLERNTQQSYLLFVIVFSPCRIWDLIGSVNSSSLWPGHSSRSGSGSLSNSHLQNLQGISVLPFRTFHEHEPCMWITGVVVAVSIADTLTECTNSMHATKAWAATGRVLHDHQLLHCREQTSLVVIFAVWVDTSGWHFNLSISCTIHEAIMMM